MKTMTSEEELRANPLALTKWEIIALERAAQEPIYASEGSSAIFDAAWELKRRGMLQIIRRENDRITYLEITEFGRRALDKVKASDRAPEFEWMRELLLQLMDKVGIPREEFESTTFGELSLRFRAKKKGR